MTIFFYVVHTPHSRTIVVGAPDGDAIDEWWREVSTNETTNQEWKRVKPDYYEYNGPGWEEARSVFKRNFIVAYDIGNRDSLVGILQLGPLNPEERTDHRDCRFYYIRSKHDRDVYWFVDNQRNVCTSRTGRTRFRSTAPQLPDGAVIISSDSIAIGACTASGMRSVEVGSGERLKVSAKDYEPATGSFTFGQLKDGFMAPGRISETHDAEVVVVSTSGEEWELVK